MKNLLNCFVGFKYLNLSKGGLFLIIIVFLFIIWCKYKWYLVWINLLINNIVLRVFCRLVKEGSFFSDLWLYILISLYMDYVRCYVIRNDVSIVC